MQYQPLTPLFLANINQHHLEQQHLHPHQATPNATEIQTEYQLLLATSIIHHKLPTVPSINTPIDSNQHQAFPIFYSSESRESEESRESGESRELGVPEEYGHAKNRQGVGGRA